MGSGLILLVIVGAWLAVLVPMALRSHDAAGSLGTVDKFHDAMRVLSRRDGAARGQDSDDEAADEVAESPEPAPRVVRRRTTAERGSAPEPRQQSGLTPAARRRRALAVLALLVVGSLVGAFLGPVWVWALHGAADLLLLGFLAWLRHETVLRAEREWRAAMSAPRAARARTAPAPAPVAVSRVRVSVPGRIAGIPDRMPSHALVDPAWTLPVADAPVPARGAQGEPWQPVPVPVPTYVTAPTAPPRSVRSARPAGRPEDLAEAERSLGIDDQGPDLDEILSRRAVGD